MKAWIHPFEELLPGKSECSDLFSSSRNLPEIILGCVLESLIKETSVELTAIQCMEAVKKHLLFLVLA